MLSLSPNETRLTSIDSFTPAPIDILLILLIDIKHQRAGISFYLINNVLMIYVITKLRLDIHWEPSNLSLGEVYWYLFYL